ncbi:MAG: NUDIX hydrolase [Micrococcales bacterium]
MTVYAAGAVLWREEKGQLKVALVHRSRYNDWAWAKGKVDPGETLLQTAVREIREETGLKVALGVKLPVLHYNLPSGEAKEVHYWAARVTDKALANSKFKPDDEVAAVEWFTPAEARKKFTYTDDIPYLEAIEKLHASKMLRTKPLIVLRHGKATPRSDWKKGEATRPLLATGKQQAKALVPMLSALGIKRVISSPWERCASTVKPFATAKGYPITERTQISEFGEDKGPRRTTKLIRDLLSENIATVVCSHRPALPTILQTIAELASPEQAKTLKASEALKPGDFTVVHLSIGDKKNKRKIIAIENYSTGIDD